MEAGRDRTGLEIGMWRRDRTGWDWRYVCGLYGTGLEIDVEAGRDWTGYRYGGRTGRDGTGLEICMWRRDGRDWR